MAQSLIRDRVHVARRYVRSVDMLRDLADPGALEGYVLTPSAKDALERIAKGLTPGATQRAFRVTGPYGSGKSSFGLLLARLVSDDGDPHAAAIATKAGPAAALRGMVPLVLTGRRASLADDLVRVVAEGNDVDHAAAAIALADARAEGRRDVRAVLDLLEGYARTTLATSGRGVLLLVDEMGRYLEHAAANPATEDPAIFQLLAERAGGSGSGHLAVVGFLHHRFADYVAGLGEWVQGEWARSSERYEEIAFQDSTEQTLHLLAAALETNRRHVAAVVQQARTVYSQAADRGVFSATEIHSAADRLYPLHPAAVACLATSARRFGQNERSVFSFLQSSEPAGFQRFIGENAYDASTWYALDQLHDYLATIGSIRFRSPDRERRWQLALEAVAGWNGASPLELRVLKALSVIAVLEPVSGLRADPECLAWSLGEDLDATTQSLSDLEDAGHVYRRPSRGDYSLWSNSSVDLERWFEEAKIAIPLPSRLDLTKVDLPGIRPLVAHRHYHQTGTMRSFAVVLQDLGERSRVIEADGRVIVRAVQPDENLDAEITAAMDASLAGGPMLLMCLLRVGPEHVRWAHELSAWRWVQENCKELRVDELAKAEVDRRLNAAEQALRTLVTPFSQPADAGSQAAWIHMGRAIEVPNRRSLSRTLSEICDETFASAPILRNELINRPHVSSAIAAARTRLLDRMVEAAPEEGLGLVGAPPERTIYLALFRQSGLHRKDATGNYAFQPPAEDPLRWRPVWDRIVTLLSERGSLGLDALLTELGAAPYGLRQGPALLVAAAFLLHSRSDVALMERGSFQPELTSSHFQRLSKNPANFALRHVGDGQERQAILERLATELSVLGPVRPSVAVKPVVQALYEWWNGLPEHAQLTQSLGPTALAVRAALRKARDPVGLLMDALPQACSSIGADGIEIDRYVETLEESLNAIGDATPTLRRRATAAILDAFASPSLVKLRAMIDLDYGPHVLRLSDYRLRSFVDRAMKADLDDDAWLEGVTSLVAGGRLSGWDDDGLDRFSFEVRELAQRLARWLALARQSHAARTPFSGVHLTTPDGGGRSWYVREDAQAPGRKRALAAVRAAIADHPDADRILAEVLVERLSHEDTETVR